jgi:hypothetical protein
LASVGDGRAKAEDQQDQRGHDDRDARNAGSQRRAPKALARLVRLALNPINQVTEVACRLGQSTLTEARVDAAFELRHGGPDVASG